MSSVGKQEVDIEAGGDPKPLQPSLLQSHDEKEGSDTMMVSYVDSFKVHLAFALPYQHFGAKHSLGGLHAGCCTDIFVAFSLQYTSDNQNLEALQSALFMHFDGALGPTPIPSRQQAVKASSDRCRGYKTAFREGG
jgi:hypothetical protein